MVIANMEDNVGQLIEIINSIDVNVEDKISAFRTLEQLAVVVRNLEILNGEEKEEYEVLNEMRIEKDPTILSNILEAYQKRYSTLIMLFKVAGFYTAEPVVKALGVEL